jgi:hypothetical protein
MDSSLSPRLSGSRLGFIACVVCLAEFFAAVVTPPAARAQAVPQVVSYQGQLLSEGTPFDGVAQFKFAIVDEASGVTVWSNDDSSTNGEEPDDAVDLDVEDGIFSVGLGSPPMVALTAEDLWAAEVPVLRVWVDTGSGFDQIPDQTFGSGGFSLNSVAAQKSHGPFAAEGEVWAKSGGFRFPDGSVQTTASIGGEGGGTLDQAYDHGGPGAGRTITADAGAVAISSTGGLTVNASITVGGTTPQGRISVQNVGGNDTTNLLSFDESTASEFFFESGFAGAGSTGNHLKLKTAWDATAMSWRGDGKVGINTINPIGMLTVESDGTGTGGAAITARNLNTGASVALTAITACTDATVVFNNTGSGDILRGFNGGGSPVFQVLNSGKMVGAGLQVTSGPLIVDSSSRIRLNGAFGSGVAGAPIYSENTSASGVAFWGKTTSTDGSMILEQNGTGSLIRAFRSGSLKFEVRNSGRVVTTALEITGGGDLSEPFTVSEGSAEPGTVLVIDEHRPGQLTMSRRAYDRRVAGVVSGANGLEPGITLHPTAHQAGGEQVALTGRVYVKADASEAPIRPGDLLTTSAVAGHVMAAIDPARAQGAVMGKAMTSLESGRGLILALVSLQ